jgi:hypothetical protein
MEMRSLASLVPLGLVFAVTAAACGSSSRFGTDGGVDGGGEGGLLDPCGGCPAGKVCVQGRGCFTCRPGTNTCSGDAVVKCGEDGEPSNEVVQPCDVQGGEVCDKGECRKACDLAADQPSNVGCEFWAVDLDNEYSQLNDAAGAPWGVVLANAGRAVATVTIERNDAPPGQPPMTAVVKTLTVQPGALEKVILPTREVDGSTMGKNEGPGTFLSSNAYRITSSAPLVVYQFNAMEQMFSNDASLLVPKNGLGTLYRVLGFPTANPIAVFPAPGIPDHAYVTVVGTVPNTKVTVTLSHPIVAGGTIPATAKGGVVTATLGPFDVLNLESDGIPGDMTGTIVEASAPVAVFTGGERGIAPGNVPGIPKPPDWDTSSSLCCTDHLEEQLFPVTAMGKNFVIPRSPVRSRGWSEPDVIRFLGIAKAASVKTNLPPPYDRFPIQPGEMKETWTTGELVVEASEPILVAQILVSQMWTHNWSVGGDPSLTVFPPIDQYRTDYLFLVPPSWTANYVAIAAETGSLVLIDGVAPQDCVVAPAGTIGTTQWEARRCPIAEGAHRMTGAKPFGVTAYGYGPAGSYAFVGGADVRKIYEPPPIK